MLKTSRRVEGYSVRVVSQHSTLGIRKAVMNGIRGVNDRIHDFPCIEI